MSKANKKQQDQAQGASSSGDVRARVASRLALDSRLSRRQIAREAGLSSTVVSQWLNGIYGGDNVAVELQLDRWLHAQDERDRSAQALPAAPGYIPTHSAERVLGALRFAQLGGDISVVYGGAGLGKTTAARHYQEQAPSVWIATMTPASASVATALEVVADAVGAGHGAGAAKLHALICQRIVGTAGLLVVDEAQHLSVAALDQIRSINDATGVGIALLGNESVYARMTGGNRAAYLDRLYSRIGQRVRLPKATDDDIDQLVGAWAAPPETRRLLAQIGNQGGALRGITKVLRLATMYAKAEGHALGVEHVRSAWRELGGTPL